MVCWDKSATLEGVSTQHAGASEQIAAFKREMTRAGVDYRFINYPGAKHSFTNPQADRFGEKFGLPLAYNEQADTQSWAELMKFFDGLFGG